MRNSGNDVLHADEGMLHSYLDGALRPDERLQVESHVAGCPACAAALQEARQLKSQATKILTRARPVERARPVARKMPDRRRKRPMVRLGWAASLFLALGAGWMARTYLPNPFAGPSPTALMESDAVDEGVAGFTDQNEVPDSVTTLASVAPGKGEGALEQERSLASGARGRRDAPAETAPASKAALSRERMANREPPAEQHTQTERQLAARPTPDSLLEDRRMAQTREEAAALGRVSGGVAGPEAAAAADAISAAMPRRVYAQPPVEVLPGYHLVEVAAGTDPLLVVSQASGAGDTVVFVYQPVDAPDSTRVFDQGVVLERDPEGRPTRVVGRYRVVGSYRVIATGGVSRDSLGVLLRLLDLR